MERVYYRAWYMGRGRRFGEYKRSNSRVQEENECKSKKTGKFGYNRGKLLGKYMLWCLFYILLEVSLYIYNLL